MKRIALLALLLIKTTIIIAQTNKLQVVDLKPGYDENRFPKIIYKENPKIEEKTNTLLQVKELELVPSVFKKHPFEKVGHDEKKCCNGTFFASWEKKNSPKNILSLKLTGEFAGAYLEDFETYYNFDLRTGNQIQSSNLFSVEGLKEVYKILQSRINSTIKNYIAKLNASKKNKRSADLEVIKEQISMYQDCLQFITEYGVDDSKFFLEKDHITFTKGRCSNHAMRAIDDLYDFVIKLSYKEIEQYLSSYGKNLLSEVQEVEIYPSPKGKMYKGKIGGKFEISAIIYESYSGDNLGMYYWYNSVKTPIELRGDFKNNTFSLSEEVYNKKKDEYETQATIKAKWIDNKKIIGTWTNSKTKKVLSFELEEY